MNASEIRLFTVGAAPSQVYAVAGNETLRIGGIDLDTRWIYPGDHMHANADIKRLDELLGAQTFDYDHALATARSLLGEACDRGIAVARAAEIK